MSQRIFLQTLQVQWALQRRGLAFDQCGLIAWSTHQKRVQQLLNLLTKDAPAGYHKVRVDLLIQADKELFTVMAQEFQMSNRRLTDSPSPMEEAMKVLCADPRITMHVLPLPKSVAAVFTTENDSAGEASAPRRPREKPKRNRPLKPKPYV